MRRFEIITALSAPPDQVFDACLDVEAHTRSMASSSERAVAGITRGSLTLGQSVTFQARHFGVTWRLTARITSWEPSRHFVDEQVAGPFKEWRHAHTFEPDGRGGTVMTDAIEFASPLGVLGRIADRAVLSWYMPRLIKSRNAYLSTIL
ncbi:SRPBCC family protein [Streptomyces sp. NPDC048441]|uniref:SRPBCC family protein n=1 Tax=Streptomyces sp. NPDC048441 TaxID=3365552 RepID=UPI003718101E